MKQSLSKRPKIGDELLHKDLDFSYPKIEGENEIYDEARIFGMFLEM